MSWSIGPPVAALVELPAVAAKMSSAWKGSTQAEKCIDGVTNDQSNYCHTHPSKDTDDPWLEGESEGRGLGAEVWAELRVSACGFRGWSKYASRGEEGGRGRDRERARVQFSMGGERTVPGQ